MKPAFFIQVDIPLTINMNPGTQVNKLGASPQLECWNIGKMGFGILQCWVNGHPKTER